MSAKYSGIQLHVVCLLAANKKGFECGTAVLRDYSSIMSSLLE